MVIQMQLCSFALDIYLACSFHPLLYCEVIFSVKLCIPRHLQNVPRNHHSLSLGYAPPYRRAIMGDPG